ncbi:Probable tonB-dependent receptor yncD precursor [plant metagenome]|uniref:Probable tonB-dependent receptor yncD n=1 Tax=plant metagenome TaxID=1297885 RepID=A0A484V7D1_9ZZZZ
MTPERSAPQVRPVFVFHSSWRLRPGALAVALLAGGLGAAHAQAAQPSPELNTLDTIVVSGSYGAISSFMAPYSVDSVDASQIATGQLRINASEALARVPGLVVQNRQNYAQDLQISSRGFGAQTPFGVRGLKLITDGIPASTPDGQGQAATFNLDTAERIEVLRGPMATLYGSNAGGVIQVFSRDGQGRPSITAETLLGSDGLWKRRLGSEGEIDGVGYVLDASRMSSDGYREHSAVRRDQGFGKLTIRPDDRSTLRVVFSSLDQRNTDDPLGLTWQMARDNPRGVASQALDFNTRKSIRHRQGGIAYERRIGDGTLSLNAYGGARRVTQYLSIPSDVQQRPHPSTGLQTHAGGVVDFNRRFEGGGAQWQQPFGFGGGTLTLTGGLAYDRSEDDRQGYENFIVEGGVEHLGVRGRLRRDEINTVTSVDPYAHASWEVGRWTLQAGLRRNEVKIEVDDHYLSNGDDTGSSRYTRYAPALGASYAVTPALHVYVNAGKGTETPSLGELAYSAGGGGFNSALGPSRSEQIEAGIKALIGEDTRVDVAVFQIRTKDELVVAEAQGGRNSYRNAGNTLRRGAELSLDSRLSPQWRAAAAFTYLDATYDSSFTNGTNLIARGNRLPGVPEMNAYAEIAWTPRPWVTTGLEAVYRGKVYVEDTNTRAPAPAYTVLNWRTQFEQTHGPWTFRQLFRLDNLLDKQYIGSVIVGDGNRRYYEPAPGIAWYAGASVQYTF